MNINKAKELGYDKVYFTFDCIGDTILLMSGLKYIYEKEKKRILVGTYYKELLENCDYIEILDDFCEDIFDKKVYDELIINGFLMEDYLDHGKMSFSFRYNRLNVPALLLFLLH